MYVYKLYYTNYEPEMCHMIHSRTYIYRTFGEKEVSTVFVLYVSRLVFNEGLQLYRGKK